MDSVDAAAPDSQPRRGTALLRALNQPTIFGLAALVATAAVLWIDVSGGQFAVDFHHEYWPAVRRVLAGSSPFLLSHTAVVSGVAFPYPPGAIAALLPFALLPVEIGSTVFTLVSIAAAGLALRVIGVRDRRLYGLVLLWPQVLNGWTSANLSLALVPLIALVWHYRAREVPAGVIAGAAIALKPFVWPLVVWLLVTRRYAASAWALLSATAITAIGFAVIGFDQVTRFLAVSRSVTSLNLPKGYSDVALLMRFGLGEPLAVSLGVAIGVVVGVGCVLAARRRDDRRALMFAVLLMLLANPVLWIYDLAVLLVPLAIRRPTLDVGWLIPVIMWPCATGSLSLTDSLLGLVVIIGVPLAAYKTTCVARPASASSLRRG